MQDNESLLDYALEWGDGELLAEEATTKLISYLDIRHELREVVDLLVSLDRTHKARVVAYSQAVNTNSLENRSREPEAETGQQLEGLS